jgi:TPR repeat protein
VAPVTARILLQRAAEAGDAVAATALGATYDPNVLAKLGVVGMNADVEKARGWYQKAESFGSPASQRLMLSSKSLVWSRLSLPR